MANDEIGGLWKKIRGFFGLGGKGDDVSQANICQRILWAMANLPKKTNSVSEITKQVNKITIEPSDGDLTEKAVRSALKRLASAKKKQMLAQPMPDCYCFSSPLMKGFVRLVRYQK